MRRREMMKAINNLLAAIKGSEIVTIFEEQINKMGRGDEGFSSPLLESLNKYSILATSYDDIERELESILGLNILRDTSCWPALFAGDTDLLLKIRKTLSLTTEIIPRIIVLLRQEYVQELAEEDTSSLPKFLREKALLSVFILEDKKTFSSPSRLVEMLDSISLLYEVCAIMVEQTTTDLVVLACDSGSDKSFDFIGAAKIVEMVKDMILSFWDRIVFYREKKLAERLDLVAQSLPIIDDIGALESAGRIGAEQAELLRRNVIKGTNKFISSGAVIPEMEVRSKFDPRALMAPEPKLLFAPDETDLTSSAIQSETGSAGADDSSIDVNKLNEQEKEELGKLLKKAKCDEPEKADSDTDNNTTQPSKEK